MRAIALFGVFLIAKIVVLSGHSLPLTVWTPIAYIWQDIIIALIFAALDRAIRRPWFGWTLYFSAVAYIALNVSVARVLSSPLTLPMIRASGGALSDSILYHATPANLASMALILVAGAVLPLIIDRLEVTRWRELVAASLVIVALGPTATKRVDTIGLHRNPFGAIVTSSLPRVSANESSHKARDWRESPFDTAGLDQGLDHLSGRAKGRNVVLVLLESAGARYLKPYGAESDPMPRLTAFAKRAVVFESAYAVYPESIKTLFSVLCARYPKSDSTSEGVGKVITPSIASELKSGGYRTALFHSGRFMYLGMEDVVQARGYDILEDAGAIGGNRESSFGVDEGSTVRRMLAWIDTVPRKEPFFLTYLPIAGHHPYNTPEPGPFPEREESERYLNALNYADTALNDLIEGLRARGLAEQTVFVVFGDHGEAFGQHDGNYGHSLFIYDENVRVPYVIAAPGIINEQLRVKQTVSLIDTAPTILDLLGLPIPDAFQGRSMLAGDNQMALFFTDYSLPFCGLRDGCWKYIYEMGAERSKLFNVCEDPIESRDVARQQPERVAAYKTRLLDWSAAQSAR